jgi:hypothetical protein
MVRQGGSMPEMSEGATAESDLVSFFDQGAEEISGRMNKGRL